MNKRCYQTLKHIFLNLRTYKTLNKVRIYKVRVATIAFKFDKMFLNLQFKKVVNFNKAYVFLLI